MKKLLLVLCLMLVATARGESQSSCLTGGSASSIIGRLRLNVEVADSARLANVGLVKVDSSEIVLVTEPAVCDSALAAFRQGVVASGATGPSQVYVVRVGNTRLVVVHPDYGSGEFWAYIVLNAATYAILGSMG